MDTSAQRKDILDANPLDEQILSQYLQKSGILSLIAAYYVIVTTLCCSLYCTAVKQKMKLKKFS